MKPIYLVEALMVMFVGFAGFLYGQEPTGRTVTFILKDNRSDRPIKGAMFTLKCEDAESDDHRGAANDTLRTVDYPIGSVLNYSIERQGYITKTDQCIVEGTKSKNTHIVYLDEFQKNTRPTVEVEGTLYYEQEGRKVLVADEDVSIQGLSINRATTTDGMGRYHLSFAEGELLNPDQGYSIKACAKSEDFHIDIKKVESLKAQNYVNFVLIPRHKDDAIEFRLYDPEGDSNVVGGLVQVFASGKLIGQGTSDENGAVRINPALEPGIRRVLIAVQMDGVAPITFRLPVEELEGPYLLNTRLFNAFSKVYGYRQTQFAVGGALDVTGQCKWLNLEVATGIGKAPKVFVGLNWTPTKVEDDFFRDLHTNGTINTSHPPSAMHQAPIGIFMKRYAFECDGEGANLFLGGGVTLRTADRHINPGNLYLGERLFAGVRYSFTKRWGAELSVIYNTSTWDYWYHPIPGEEVGSWMTVHSLMFQLKFDYCKWW